MQNIWHGLTGSFIFETGSIKVGSNLQYKEQQLPQSLLDEQRLRILQYHDRRNKMVMLNQDQIKIKTLQQYEAIWKKPIEQDSYTNCPKCESTVLSREFCGEYICENCRNNFGVCNLWNNKPMKYPVVKVQEKRRKKDRTEVVEL